MILSNHNLNRMTPRAVLALGTNIEPRKGHLVQAVAGLRNLPGTQVLNISKVYETEPVGGPPQDLFLNAALLIATELAPIDLLTRLERLENDLGRTHKGGALPRTIDLDIIFYNGLRIAGPELEIPHPRFRERGFVLQPLADIIPRFRDPVTNNKVEDLLRRWVGSGGRPATGHDWLEDL